MSSSLEYVLGDTRVEEANFRLIRFLDSLKIESHQAIQLGFLIGEVQRATHEVTVELVRSHERAISEIQD